MFLTYLLIWSISPYAIFSHLHHYPSPHIWLLHPNLASTTTSRPTPYPHQAGIFLIHIKLWYPISCPYSVEILSLPCSDSDTPCCFCMDTLRILPLAWTLFLFSHPLIFLCARSPLHGCCLHLSWAPIPNARMLFLLHPIHVLTPPFWPLFPNSSLFSRDTYLAPSHLIILGLKGKGRFHTRI